LKPYTFETNCVNSDGESIQEMVDAATETTYETMVRNCEGLLEWAVGQGYERRSNKGLTLKNDWHVAYHRSTFRGKPCYFLVWSAIEYVWTKEEP
jgi:hypothetical protein